MPGQGARLPGCASCGAPRDVSLEAVVGRTEADDDRMLDNRPRLSASPAALSGTLRVACLVVLSLHLFAFTSDSFLELGITCYTHASRGEIECCETFLCQMIYLTYTL